MAMINEDTLEMACLGWFGEIGWVTYYGPDVLPSFEGALRENLRQVVLPSHVAAALKRLNPGVPSWILDEALRELLYLNGTSLLSNNKKIQGYFIHGIQVKHQTSDGHDTATWVKVLDFEDVHQNEFLVINQFTVQGATRRRRPDIVAFINGLPVVVIELKNPADETCDIVGAFHQIQTYKNDVEDLFYYNVACVIADGSLARIGSLTANLERFMPWRTIVGDRDDKRGRFEEEVLIKGFFQKEFLLDYIQHFILFDHSQKEVIKKIAGYHQFHAVRRAVKKTLEAVKRKDGKGGVVWHTQGSGKSISMLCFANKVMKHPEMENPTLVVLTDRNDLDGQLFDVFSTGNPELNPVHVDSSGELKTLLGNRPSGGVVFTTIQKFDPKGEEHFPLLSSRSNIVVISDEAHRSHYGFEAKIRKNGVVSYGYAKYLRDALPNACFIGFTGTPIEAIDKDTQAVFGNYIDVYDIQDAINDKATVPIYYEARQIPIRAKDGYLLSIDAEIEEITEDMNEREAAKTRWATVEALVDTKPRLEVLAKDLIEHFENRCSVLEGKGMIVCMSRKICVHLYDEIVRSRPDWHSEDPKKGVIKVIMTGSASDPLEFQQHIYSPQVKRELEARVKNPEDVLKLVIVRDMWLTGFDAPSLHTMYVDKPMKGHNLMQAIARVNRVFRDKPAGLVVDYIGIARDLEHAVGTYTGSGGRGNVAIDVQRAFEEFQAHFEVCQDLLTGFDYSEFRKKAFELLPNAVDHVLGRDNGKVRFADACLNATTAYALCKNQKEAFPFNDELAFFQYVRSVLVKKEDDGKNKKSSDAEVQSAIKAIVSNAIMTDGVIDIFQSVGLDKPNISIISDAFLNNVKNIKQKHLAVELLQRLIKGEIKTKFKLNMAMGKKFSEALQEIITRYNNGTIETSQVIEELIALAQATNAEIKRGAELGLSEAEKAFYDTLEKNESAVRELGDDILKKIAIDLTDYLRKSVRVDWSKVDSVRAAIMIKVKRILKKYKYPPDQQKDATERILEQAELFGDEFA